ncbi:site-specific integrase [Paenibacillus bouchesdurhonensis]|uniref:tyrosine-type recombinase/integrase n=1 Tax=Paenibacillus bouchesdurhonensis TaxID=1870990 RepID=UPI00227724AD|nr:tyrosine-type recombinase/integrase [Paenibacillus bouchesdurhonensis]
MIAFSGLRPGELCALKWTDINFKTRELRITKTLYTPENNMYNYELTPPKTVGSIRTIELDESILTMLKDYKKNLAARQERYKKTTRIFTMRILYFREIMAFPKIRNSFWNG